MSVKLTANYSKRLGLPGYSSHQFSVSVETEVINVDEVRAESARLYTSLQEAVDAEIINPGFVAPDGYGLDAPAAPAAPTSPGNANGNGNGTNGRRTNGTSQALWGCSDKQRDLILKITEERHLDKNHVEDIALQMFGVGVRSLNKLQASGLIDELLGNEPAPARRPARGTRPTRRNGAAASPEVAA